MRTVRIKLYFFNELSNEAKRNAILSFRVKTKWHLTSDEDIIKWAVDNNYEFTVSGKLA